MISVVIPVYNCEDTIIQCIQSVIDQTRFDLIDEIIVINDGSTDGTIDKINEIFTTNKIRIISKFNGGVSSARNLGIKNSSSDWIALLDSDDVWVKDKIEQQVFYINSYKDINFIGSNRNNEDVHIGKKIDQYLYKMNLKSLLIKTWPHTSTALINKKVFDRVGYYDENLKYSEDNELWCRIVEEFPIYYIRKSLEIAGNDKRPFGAKGLSANHSGMYKGIVINLKRLKKRKSISLVLYLFLRSFNYVKLKRRIVLSRR